MDTTIKPDYLKQHHAGICPECGGTMKRGVYIREEIGGRPDFIGGEVVTMSPTGRGKICGCWKCKQCGHSEMCK